MKKLLLLLSLISFNAFATDRGVPCNSNSCKVKIVTKDSGGTEVKHSFSSDDLMVGSDSITGSSAKVKKDTLLALGLANFYRNWWFYDVGDLMKSSKRILK